MSPTIRWIIRAVAIAMLVFFAWAFMWMAGELGRQNERKKAMPTEEEPAGSPTPGTAMPAPARFSGRL